MAEPAIIPTFRFRNAAAMIDWLQRAFGFTVLSKFMDGEKVGHAELALGSSVVMCGSERDDAYGAMVGSAAPQGGKSLYVAVDDVDAMFEHASGAGATIEEGLTEREYGSREFICRDPEGNVWCFGTYRPQAG